MSGAAGAPDDWPFVAIYADESCLGNGREGENPGGAGVLVEYRTPEGPIVRRDLWLSEPGTTNNRMALRSAIEALRTLGRKGTRFRVVFTSDSQYLVKGAREWVHGWAARGWRRSGGAIENLELWWDLCEAGRGHAVEWRWVRGHAGHAQNEYVNHLAIRAAEGQLATDGFVDSDFEQWWAAWRASRPNAAAPEAFPDPVGFRPSRTLPPPPVGRPSA